MKPFILFLFLLLPFCVNAQVNETFEGPELDAGWIGKNRDSFKINEEGRLQLAIQPVRAGNLSIGREIAYSATMQWEFDVHMRQAPSQENKLCVYLYQEDEKRYYYVRIGNSGAKELGLMCHGKSELIAPRTDFAEMPLLLHIKVTLEENERWMLYSRPEGESYYLLEGSCRYAMTDPPERGNMIFTFYYTKTRSGLFSIDNVRVSDRITPTPLGPDESDPPAPSFVELPQLLEVTPVSASLLRYAFDQPVEIKEALFRISDIGTAYRTTYADKEKRTTVHALFEKEMEAGKTYTLSYQGVTDLSGHPLPDFSEEMVLEEETADVLPGAIRINEVMAKPGKAQGMTEYVELYNHTSVPVSLNGWEYRNVTGKKTKRLPDVSIAAGGYAVLYDSGKSLSVEEKALRIPIEKFPALNDHGASLHLYHASGTLIDSVTYTGATVGRSWEYAAAGWHLSTDPRGGTPGSANSSPEEEEEPPAAPDLPAGSDDPDDPDGSDDPAAPDIPAATEPVRSGTVIINELLPDPSAGGSEYIELYNRSEQSLSLSTLSVATRKADGTLGTRYPLTAVPHELEAKSFLLLTKSVEGVTAFYEIADPSALCEMAKLPVLANTSSTLVLFRTADGTVIDEVAYSSKWHAYSVKNKKGVALERIDPDAPTQEVSNWTSASEIAGYGTPGYQNSQYKAAPPGDATGIEPPVWIEESGSYTLSYRLDRPGYNCRAFVFNTSGLRVAEISNHALLGTSGLIRWSGTAHNGRPLPTGVYLFYAEIYHPEGRVKRVKKAFLIR